MTLSFPTGSRFVRNIAITYPFSIDGRGGGCTEKVRIERMARKPNNSNLFD